MAINENYASDPAVAFEGMVADTAPAVIISRTVQGAAGLGFGKAACKGSADHTVKADTSAATDLVGIAVRSVATENASVDKYPEKDTAALMRQGVIWVKVTDAGGVVEGDPVWVKKSDGTFSNADAGSGGSFKLAGARWESTGANNALAKVRVNFDVPAVAGA